LFGSPVMAGRSEEMFPMSKRFCLSGCTGLALAFLGLATQRANASVELLTWSPVPTSGATEINYDTTAGLQTGPGAIGNGDGTLPVTAQTPGGLQSDTIVNVPLPIPGSFPSSLLTGGTGFYDTTLVFGGLAPVGSAVSINLGGGLYEDSQVLGSGTFALYSTTPALYGNPATETLLLGGTITAATVVTGIDMGTSGAAFNSQGVTYTGGAIVTYLPSYAILSGNDMSVSMTTIAPPFSINGMTGQLNSFTANATGLFDINTPEPATLGIMTLVGSSLLVRRRRVRS
jgi:hypothetical protein